MPKFGTPGWAQSSVDRGHGSLDFQEHHEDLEHDQARHQGVHGHGQSETCENHRAIPGSARKLAYYKYFSSSLR